MAAGELEVAYGMAAKTSQASRAELDLILTRLNPPADGATAHAFLHQESKEAAGGAEPGQ